MLPNAEPIHRSLELCAERLGDPAPLIYQRFFSKYPNAVELFGDDPDDSIKGHMIEKIFMLLMELADGNIKPQFSAFWVADHEVWKVEPAMIFDMFDIIVGTLREGVGDAWTADMERAWQDLIASMMPAINAGMGSASGGDSPESVAPPQPRSQRWS